MTTKMHEWFDTLMEPKRFFIFMLIVGLPTAILFGMGEYLSPSSKANWLRLSGFIYGLVWMISRIIYTIRRKKGENRSQTEGLIEGCKELDIYTTGSNYYNPRNNGD